MEGGARPRSAEAGEIDGDQWGRGGQGGGVALVAPEGEAVPSRLRRRVGWWGRGWRRRRRVRFQSRGGRGPGVGVSGQGDLARM